MTETIECIDTKESLLVFAPAESLTDEQRERAKSHLSRCVSCQIDMDIEGFLARVRNEENSRP